MPLSPFVPFYLPIAAPFVYLKTENSNYLALGGVLTQPLRLLGRTTTRKTPWLVCSIQDLDNYQKLFLLFFLICLGPHPQLGVNGRLLCQALRPQRIELFRSSRFVSSIIPLTLLFFFQLQKVALATNLLKENCCLLLQ